MASEILFCSSCNKYTLDKECLKCGKKTVPTKPPKFSPDDKYGKYRREVKRRELEKKGLA
jgi:H/ACA ribonucleoprotein complex subunit 3